MPALLICQRVADFAVWRARFDEDDAVRRANGCQGVSLFRNATEPSEVLALMEWDDLERARLFVQSDLLQEAMARAGVTDRPDVWLLEDI